MAMTQDEAAKSGHNANARKPARVLCIGETMVAFSPVTGGLETSSTTQMFVAGAEANVAVGLAHLGHEVEWFGRVGDDPFGVRIRSSLEARGVAAARIAVDPARPTGIYFKDRFGSRSTVYYYRAGSAASALGVMDVHPLALADRELVHVSGITPALSPSADAFVGAILAEAGRRAVSFDVNYRAKLWPVDVAAPRILELARQARIVLAGRDEAEMLWGTGTPDEIRALFPDTERVVVKDAHVGATEFHGDTVTFVAAPLVEVVEPIGAGDAFAAGYLGSLLRGESGESALRMGHVMAAQTLRNVSDSPVLPNVSVLRELAARTGEDWSRLVFADRDPSAGRAR